MSIERAADGKLRFNLNPRAEQPKPKQGPKVYPTVTWVNEHGQRISHMRTGNTHDISGDWGRRLSTRTSVAEAAEAVADMKEAIGGTWTEEVQR